jgi:hypothetical protein
VLLLFIGMTIYYLGSKQHQIIGLMATDKYWLPTVTYGGAISSK